MTEELIKSYGAAVDSKTNQLSGMSVQLKMLENQEYALQQQLSTQTDRMTQLFDQLSEFDQLDIQIQRSIECKVLTPGSNQDKSFTILPINELKSVYHQYITGLSEPISDSELTWNNYYNTLESELQSYKTSWISEYGSVGEVANNELRYNQFSIRILRGLIDSNVGPLIEYSYSFLKDGPLLYRLNQYVEMYYFNDVVVNSMIAAVSSMENSQLRYDLMECLEAMTGPESYQRLGGLIVTIPDYALRGSLLMQFENLKIDTSQSGNSTLPELINSIASLSGSDLFGSSQRILNPCYRLIILLKTTSNPYIKNHSDELIEIVLSLIQLQYRRESIYNGIMNLDISSTESNDALSAMVTRSFIETEHYDWETHVGLELIKERIQQRKSQDPDFENLITAVEFLEGKVPEGLVNCPQFFLEPGASVQQSVESKLKELNPIDLEDVRTELLSNLLQVSGNKSLANYVYIQLQQMGTEQDPMKKYVDEINQYFSSLSLSASAEGIENRIQAIFSRISSSNFNQAYKVHLSEITEKFLNRSLSSYRRAHEMDRAYRLLLTNLGYTHFLKLRNLLQALSTGHVSLTTESLINFLGDFPPSQLTLVGFYLKVLTRPDLGYDYNIYYTELSDLVHDSEFGLSYEDADCLMSYVNTLHHGRVILQERSRYQQEIISLLNKLPLHSNTTRSFRLAHLLVGGCLGDEMLENLRFELESLCYQHSSNISKSLSSLKYFIDNIVDGDVYTLIITELTTIINERIKPSAISQCLGLMNALYGEDDPLIQEMIQSEILAHYCDNEQNTVRFENPIPNENSHLDWNLFSLKVWSILENLQEPGLTELQIASFHNDMLILLGVVDIGSSLKGSVEDLYYMIRNNSSSKDEVDLLRKVLMWLTQETQLYGELLAAEQMLNNVRIEIETISVEDSRSNALSALYSIVSENRDRNSATNNLYSAAVNNMAPTFRINSVAGNRITITNVASSTGNMGNYSWYRPEKYKLFGGDKILDSIRRLRSPNSSYNKVFNSINQKISGVRMEIHSISSDVRSELGLRKIKNSVTDTVRDASDEIQNILCLLDFSHDLLRELNGVAGDVISGLRSTISNLNGIMNDLLSELKRLFRMLANLGAVSMGVHCSCMSFNFNMNLDDLSENLANWICCLNLSVPNPFMNLYGPFIEPKLGCPQYLLDMLRTQLNPNGTEKLSGRGFQTSQNLDGIFSSTSSVRLK